MASVAAFLALSKIRPDRPASSRPADTSVAAAPLERTLRLTGTTAGEHSVILHAPYLRGSRTRGGGDFRLTLKDLVAQGSRVAVGEVLAVFDNESMLERLDTLKDSAIQSEATLRALKAKLEADRLAHDQQVRVAKSAVDKATLDMKTVEVRSAIQADLFRLALEEARAQYDQLRSEQKFLDASQAAQVKAAELEIAQSQLEVRRAEVNAERMVVRAPQAGIVVMRETVRSGQFDTIRAGDELRPGQPYLDIVAPGPMIVEASANQVDLLKLHIGDHATVTPDAFPDIHLPARVYAIGSLARSSAWRANFVSQIPVSLRIERADARVIPSLSVSAEIDLGPAEAAEPAGLEAALDN